MGVPEGLLDLIKSDPRIGVYLDLCKETQLEPSYDYLLRKNFHLGLVRFTPEAIVEAMRHLVSAETETPKGEGVFDFRVDEQKLLSKGIESEFLRSKPAKLSDYQSPSMSRFSEISLVDRLKETRVFTGFSRVTRQPVDVWDNMSMLFKNVPTRSEQWLPAYSVLGEGIYLTFDAEAISQWAKRPEVLKRYEPLRETTQYLNTFGGEESEDMLPRYVLLHTFAHVMINQLVFDCGYSAAALRERIYCLDEPHNISGLLIYTAAGDSDGTMGGLVRMGKPDRLDEAIETAIENARWCSTDPVCIEVPATNFGGRTANLAACHNCSLLPETSCERFNSFLDRAALVGTIDNLAVGFFN
jgi:hypothetical protein